MKGPVYLYSHFKNFHVNHRNVVRSVSRKQIAGESITKAELDKRCQALSLNKEFPVTTSFSGVPLVADAPLSPCGLYPSLIPKEGYVLTLKSPTTDPSLNKPQPADTTIIIKDNDNVAWDGLKGNRFKQSKEGTTTQWIDVEQRNFF